jgi:ribosomal protein L7/L12
MRTYLNTLDTVEQIISDHANQAGIVAAAKNLQARLLRAALVTVCPKRVKLTYGLTHEEAALANRRDGKIPAIKLYRQRTLKGLKDSKDAVEHYMEKVLGFRWWPADTVSVPVPSYPGDDRFDTNGNTY